MVALAMTKKFDEKQMSDATHKLQRLAFDEIIVATLSPLVSWLAEKVMSESRDDGDNESSTSSSSSSQKNALLHTNILGSLCALTLAALPQEWLYNEGGKEPKGLEQLSSSPSAPLYKLMRAAEVAVDMEKKLGGGAGARKEWVKVLQKIKG